MDVENSSTLIAQKRSAAVMERSEFDFSNNCFICGKECNKKKEQRQSQHKRRRIYRVSGKTDIVGKVLAAADAVEDSLGLSVKQRLPENINLVENNAVYHHNCLSSFLKRRKHTHESPGRPQNLENLTKFESICKELETTDRKQFLLDDLYDKMGESAPTKHYFKELLEKRFGSQLIFSQRGSSKTVITLRKYLDDVLLKYYKLTNESHSVKDLKKSGDGTEEPEAF